MQHFLLRESTLKKTVVPRCDCIHIYTKCSGGKVSGSWSYRLAWSTE